MLKDLEKDGRMLVRLFCQRNILLMHLTSKSGGVWQCTITQFGTILQCQCTVSLSWFHLMISQCYTLRNYWMA